MKEKPKSQRQGESEPEKPSAAVKESAAEEQQVGVVDPYHFYIYPR